jgi:hypothetical protein
MVSGMVIRISDSNTEVVVTVVGTVVDMVIYLSDSETDI